jgi:Sugar kinases, ribokinase family
MKIVAMTELCVDYYERQGKVRAGGSSLNFAAQCRKNGAANVSLLGAVGTDSYADAIVEFIDRQGIERSRVRKLLGRTATNRVICESEASRCVPEAKDGGVSGSFALSEEDWAYVGGRDLVAIPASDANFREALRRLPSRALVCDFQDMRDYKLMEETISSMRMAFVNGDDAVSDRMHSLSKRCATVIVVDQGERGFRVFYGGEVRAVSAGANTAESADAFKAAFSLAYWAKADIRAAMEAGVAAAAAV